MSKVICIFPQDFTTEFLRPLCEHICVSFGALEVGFDTSGEDDPHELIYNAISNAQTIFFLGHGRSDCLYASTIDNDKLIDENNISLLSGKNLFLLACNSGDFIHHYELRNAVGFGFLPTSIHDVESVKRFHGLDIIKLKKLDVDFFNDALVSCLINTLSIETFNDHFLFSDRFRFNVSKKIVECLINKSIPESRLVADELFYVYKDLVVQ